MASGMTFAGMEAYTYSLADEAPNDVFPSTTVGRYINQGIKLVARLVPTIPVSQTFAVVAGTGEYELTDPIIEGRDSYVDSVWLDGRRLSERDYNAITDRTREGTPSFFYRRGAFVGLYPVPAAAATLVVDFQQEPADLVNPGDVPPLSSAGRELACIYAVYLMKLSDDEYSNADRWKERFDRGIRELAGPRSGIYKGV